MKIGEDGCLKETVPVLDADESLKSTGQEVQSKDQATLTNTDFQRAYQALKKANVPGPYYAYFSEKNPFYVKLLEWEAEERK